MTYEFSLLAEIRTVEKVIKMGQGIQVVVQEVVAMISNTTVDGRKHTVLVVQVE